MPFGDVFLKITSEYYQLTVAERKVADYIGQHRKKTQYMSISELAEECGVAEATISRFCRRLDYKGYNAFKLAVANSSGGRTTGELVEGEILPDDTIENMAQKIYSADVDAASQTLKLINPDQITAAADALCRAGKVLCMGQGGSMLLAHEAAHMFSTCMGGYYPIWDSHMQVMAASQLVPQDVVLMFSYSASTKDLVELLKIVKDRGATSILITRFPKSPGAIYADIILQCGAKEGPLEFGSIAARVAQLFLIDVLFHEVMRRDVEGCKVRRDRTADAVADKHI